MIANPKLHPNFWLGCLQLLYWIFFRPFTFRIYLSQLDSALPEDFTLWQARRYLRVNPSLQLFLSQQLFLTACVPAIFPLIMLITTHDLHWARGLAVSVLYAAIFRMLFSMVSSVVPLAGSIILGINGGVIDVFVFSAIFGLAAGAGFDGRSNLDIETKGIGWFPMVLAILIGSVVGIVASIMYGILYGIIYSAVAAVIVLAINSRLLLFVYYFCAQLLWWMNMKWWPERGAKIAKNSPIFWDEAIKFPLPWLDLQLIAIAQQDPEVGYERFTYVNRNPAQRWAVRQALIALTAHELEVANSTVSIANFANRLQWLGDAREQANDLPLALFESASREVLAGLERDNSELKRHSFASALRALQRFSSASVTARDHRTAVRFGLIAEQWQRIIEGEQQLLKEQAEARQTVVNPYSAGYAASPDSGIPFKGRADLFRELEDKLAVAAARKPTLVLHGQRRMGKTSVLRQFPVRLPEVVAAFIDLQAPGATASLAECLGHIANCVVTDARLYHRTRFPPLKLDDLRDAPLTRFREWLETVETQLGERLLLLNIDEFETLQEAIAAGRLDMQVLDMLRNLIQHHPRLVLIFAGSHMLDELAPYWSSYFINTTLVRVGVLDEAAARELIVRPTEQFPADYYEDGAVERILELTQRQPYLIQLLCETLINQLNLAGRRQASRADIDEVVLKVLERGSSAYFVHLWNDSDAVSQSILRMVAERGCCTLADFAPLAADDAVRAALRALRRRELLRQDGDEWRYEIELVRLWVLNRERI